MNSRPQSFINKALYLTLVPTLQLTHSLIMTCAPQYNDCRRCITFFKKGGKPSLFTRSQYMFHILAFMAFVAVSI